MPSIELRQQTGTRLRIAALLLSAAVAAGACEGRGGDEPTPGEIPEVAAVEIEPGAVEVEPGEIELKLAEIKLEEVLPFGRDDIGKVIMASGYAMGRPLPGGFFLLTEDSRILFVETTERVMPGDIVRVAGPLQAATAVVFEGWEQDAFELEGGVRGDWEVQREWYIDANVVEVYRRVNRASAAVEVPVPSRDTQPSPDTQQSTRP